MPDSLSALAPAKINLVLEVLGRRPDGYHEIDTILQTVELGDEVRIAFNGGPPIGVTGPWAHDTPADGSNLAWQAAEALASRAGRPTGGLRIEIVKRVPPAAGMGGGASDAATVLRLLQRAWGADERLVEDAAAAVGSDEPFFLAGGTARARGRGEAIDRLKPLPRHGVVVFVPATRIERKTATMFAALAGLPFDRGDAVARFLSGHPRELTAADLTNSFERVAGRVFPGFLDLRERITRAIGGPIRLSGAGPALFWVGPPDSAAEVMARARGLDCTTISTVTTDSQWTQ